MLLKSLYPYMGGFLCCPHNLGRFISWTMEKYPFYPIPDTTGSKNDINHGSIATTPQTTHIFVHREKNYGTQPRTVTESEHTGALLRGAEIAPAKQSAAPMKKGRSNTHHRGLAAVTRWVRLKYTAMNLKKLANWSWKNSCFAQILLVFTPKRNLTSAFA